MGWPIRAATERGNFARARAALASVLDRIADIQPVASRADSLLLLWEAAFVMVEFRNGVIEAALRDCSLTQYAHDWRTTKLHRMMVLMLASVDFPASHRLIDRLPAGPRRDHIERAWRGGDRRVNSAFFEFDDDYA